MGVKILLFIYFINEFINSYIVLPFDIIKKSINTSLEIGKQLEILLEKEKVISTISFGEEPKGLELYLSLDEYTFFLSNDACYSSTKSSYNPFLSNSYKNTTDYIDLHANLKKYCRAIEKCSIYNDLYLNKNISINNISFLFGVNVFAGKIDNSSKICGKLGLQIYNSKNQFRNDYFVNSLKQSKIIDSYTWTILYLNSSIEKNDILNYTNKEHDGILICGISEEDYNYIFRTKNIKTVKAEARTSDSLYWDIISVKVSYEYTKNKQGNYESLDNRITFSNQINHIICTEYYFNSIKSTFFDEPIKNNICTIIEKVQPMGSNIIVCDKEIMKQISEFPKISFYHKELDFIFELTYKDLFIEYNNKILFLVVYNSYGQNIWYFGKIFMKKYPFVFDYDKKTISFVNVYNINKSDNDQSNSPEMDENEYSFWYFFKIIIIIILIILGIIVGVFIGRMLWYKNRKKRANELDDDYEYSKDKMNNKNEILNLNKENKNKNEGLFNE
jgi:hypothetical protein